MDDEVRVLLIEDDGAAAEMYRMRLAADGYTVSLAHDGEEGLRAARDNPPDLIYLDLRLPKMDGFAVLEQLRATPSTAATPVIFLSNHGEPELREQGLKLGALEFLVKAETTPALLAESADRVTENAPPVPQA